MNRSMMIKTRNGYQLVDIDKVLFIERMDRKNKMVMVDGSSIPDALASVAKDFDERNGG